MCLKSAGGLKYKLLETGNFYFSVSISPRALHKTILYSVVINKHFDKLKERQKYVGMGRWKEGKKEDILKES